MIKGYYGGLASVWVDGYVGVNVRDYGTGTDCWVDYKRVIKVRVHRI